MYSFLKIHTEKYPYQDPITSAHNPVGDTLSQNATGQSLYLHYTYFIANRLPSEAPLDYHFHIISGLMMSTHS